ncbi:MAG: hypothetical protein JWO70_453, partial [Betaproteobacteria bacterium]|nr:hypothetical protein [Betaproteobacteria bacterium]
MMIKNHSRRRFLAVAAAGALMTQVRVAAAVPRIEVL